MEVIAASIRSSLVPFLAEKLAEFVDTETIQSYVDEWLNDGKPGKPIKKRAAQKAKKEEEIVQVDHQDDSLVKIHSREEYEKMKVTELKAICKERGLSCVGTKAALIDKILGETKSEKKPKKSSPDHSDTEKKPKRKPKDDADDIYNQPTDDDEDEQPPKRKLKSKKRDTQLPKVIEKVKQVMIDIVTDQFGNDIHEETGLVFNKDNEVVGRVDEEGSVIPLTKADIDLCRRCNFSCVRDSDFEDE